jgi:hypothetical protein
MLNWQQSYLMLRYHLHHISCEPGEGSAQAVDLKYDLR